MPWPHERARNVSQLDLSGAQMLENLFHKVDSRESRVESQWSNVGLQLGAGVQIHL